MNTRQLSELEIRSDAVTRREFVKLTAATGLAVGVGSLTYAGAAEKNASGIPVRMLGRTGEKVSALSLGGYHIGLTASDSTPYRCR